MGLTISSEDNQCILFQASNTTYHRILALVQCGYKRRISEGEKPDKQRQDGLRILLTHSDYEGRLTVEECEKVQKAITLALSGLSQEIYLGRTGPGSTPGKQCNARDTIQQFHDGLLYCIATNQEAVYVETIRKE